MAVDASATAMASLRIFIPFHVRSDIEPPEYIMRAPVAAQARDCRALLPKSRSCYALPQRSF
jgi:hypothetical protein